MARAPYLPDSALKGVLAAPHDEAVASEEGEEGPRERLFGRGDEGARRGRPGSLVIGNGELLAFPSPLAGGGRAWIVPALGAAAFLDHEGSSSPQALDLLERLEQAPEDRRAFATPALPRLAFPIDLLPVPAGLAKLGGHALLASLRRLAGTAVPPGAPLLVVASPVAAELWRTAAERRVLTGLDARRRTVSRGSLRAVEAHPRRLGLPQPGQPPRRRRVRAAATPPARRLGEPRPRLGRARAARQAGPARRHRRAGAAHRRHRRRRRRATGLVRAGHGRDAPGDPGPRRGRRGEAHGGRPLGPQPLRLPGPRRGSRRRARLRLAKAKLADRKPAEEARAHRWLLSALVTESPDPLQAAAPCHALVEWLKGEPFAAGRLESLRDLVLARSLWLRRHAELGLPAGGD